MTAPNHHQLYDAVQQSAKTQPVTLHYWERRSRPRLPAPSFPGSQGRREALHWGQEPWPRQSFGTNVDSLHILSDRPWGASRKMLRSPCRAHGLSER